MYGRSVFLRSKSASGSGKWKLLFTASSSPPLIESLRVSTMAPAPALINTTHLLTRFTLYRPSPILLAVFDDVIEQLRLVRFRPGMSALRGRRVESTDCVPNSWHWVRDKLGWVANEYWDDIEYWRGMRENGNTCWNKRTRGESPSAVVEQHEAQRRVVGLGYLTASRDTVTMAFA